MARDGIPEQLSRRGFCGVLLATTTVLGGCFGQAPAATDPETRRSPTGTTTIGTETKTTDTREQRTETVDTGVPPTETSDTPGQPTETTDTTTAGVATPTETPLNTTTYAAAWPFGPDGVVGHTYETPLGEESTESVLLASAKDWSGFSQAVEEATDVSLADYPFAQETNFAEESVLVFQTRVSSGGSRLQVRAIEHVDTTEPRVTVSEVRTGPQNSAPTRVVLVRLPDEGTPPTGAVVRFVDGSSETTIQADTFEET